MIIKITRSEDGTILRFFLKEVLGLSSHAVARLKGKENGILLNGKRVTVRAILTAGDSLSLAVEDERSNDTVLARPIPVRLLYEDEAMAVAEKPSGMPTHPSHGHFEDTLANALAYLYRDIPFVFRAITRLDRETSGAVLVARNALCAHRLTLAMKQGEIGKSYFALVHGKTPPKGRIALPIRRREGSVILREAHPEGAVAVTLYKTIAVGASYSLVAVFPETGRTHQIRLHFASIGHPLLGDCLYGREGDGFPRTMLHAARLAFLHPASGLPFCAYAPVPDDFLAVLHSLALPVPTKTDAIPEEAFPSACFKHEG